MSDDKASYEELQQRLDQAEGIVDALRHGEVDLVIGERESLVVRFKSVVQEKERLRTLLDIVRRINQLIVYEDDPQRLLQSAVDCFGESELFHAAWIGQVDESKQTIRAFENGWGDVFKPVAEQMNKGSPPACVSKALKTPGVTIVSNPEAECAGCPLSGHYENRCALVTRLEHKDLIYGVLALCAPAAVAREKDARGLCAEISSDIGFAIHRIGLNQLHRKTEQRLRESEERLSLAGKAAYDLIYEWNPAKDTLEWFGDIDEKLGYGKGEISSDINAWLGLIHPEDKPRLENAVELRKTSTQPIQYEYRVRRKDGVYRHWKDRGLPVLDDKGRPHKWVGICADITEQVQAREALRKSELRYRSHFENASDVIYSLDSELRITDISPSVEKALGYKPEELIGRRFQELNLLAEPYQRQALSDAMRLLQGEPLTATEYQFVARDGSIKWAEINSSPLVRDGQVVGTVSVARDITERKRAEAERDQLAAAIRHAGEAIIITDPQGTIDYVNPAFEAMTGYSSTEVVGRNPSILKSGKQDDAFYRELWQTITDGRTWQGRIVNKRKDGTLYTEDATISPVLDRSGRIVNYVAVQRDITQYLRVAEDKAKLEEQLRQAQKMEAIGQLAGGVAHDFNNMLSVILGYADDILQQLHQDDPLREEVEEIMHAGRRSAQLTRQLLAFGRKQPLQPQVLDPNDLLKNLDRMLRRVLGEDIDLLLALAEDLAPVEIDPGQFDQVITNLAVNARDAMPTGGKLTIETSNVEIDELYAKNHVGVVPGNYVMISVTDTGCGMDKEVLSRIFDPFFTTKEKGTGTGLGLSSAYGIVKQSGGNIWAYSEPGKGTTFKVYLPQTSAKPQEQQDYSKKDEVAAGKHVLVVEDQDALRLFFEAALSRRGFQVTTAPNGGEALSLVEEKALKPDLLITDVVMPHMSGTELAKRLRTIQPDLKVLYMSGYTDNAIVHHGLLDPGTPFIQKPFSIRDLSAKIQEALREGEAPDAT